MLRVKGNNSGGSGPAPLPLGECFDIRNYGGKADYGVAVIPTDNGPAFVAAFAALNAAGGGYVCAPYDARFPGGKYDIKTPVDINLGGVGTNGASGLIGSGSASPVVVDPAYSNANIVFRFTGGDTSPFVVKNLVMDGTTIGGNLAGDAFNCFQVTDQTAIFQSCVWNDLNGVVGVVYCYSCRVRFDDCTFNTCSAPLGYGIVVLEQFILSLFKNCFWQDAPVALEAFIRMRDPAEYPNIGLSTEALQLNGCTFGEQATHSVYCKPVTPGKRIPYIHIFNSSFEMNSGTTVGASQQPTSVNISTAEKVRIEQCDFLWTGHPLSIAVQLVDAGDVVLDQIHTDVPGAHIDIGHQLAGAGANRIVVDSLTRSIKLHECDYSYLEADCPTIEIIKDGVQTVIQQDTGVPGFRSSPLEQSVVAEDSFASLAAVPATGGTGTIAILVEPYTTVDLDALVTANSDTQPGAAGIGPGSARLTAGATVYQGAAVTTAFSAPIATQANPLVHLDGRDTADTPFQSGGGAPPTAAWSLGTVATPTSDQALLTVTNPSANAHDFYISGARSRQWAQWSPSMLIDLFGNLLEGFYDDTSLHNNAGKVDVWYDRSGKHNDLIQANGAKQPTYTAAGNNGLPQADFTGAQSLVAASMTLLRASGLAQGSILTVAAYSAAADAVMWSLTPTGLLLPNGSVTQGELAAGIGGTEYLQVVGMGTAQGSPVTPGLFETRMSCFYDIVRDMFIDGTAFATEGLNVAIGANNQLTLGDIPPGGQAMTGSIQAVIVLNQAAQYDQVLLDKIQAWAKARYATP